MHSVSCTLVCLAFYSKPCLPSCVTFILLDFPTHPTPGPAAANSLFALHAILTFTPAGMLGLTVLCLHPTDLLTPCFHFLGDLPSFVNSSWEAGATSFIPGSALGWNLTALLAAHAHPSKNLPRPAD